MNKEAMLAVADVIEYADRMYLGSFTDWNDHTWRSSGSPSINEVWHDCGTTACIAGWVATWADREASDGMLYVSIARQELGLDHEQARKLFYGEDYFWIDNGLSGEHYDDAKAVARVMRDIANGKITL